jgi:predicted amidohydrolase
MDQLKVYGLQVAMEWEDIQSNLAKYSDYLEMLNPEEVDVVVLPEMFQTGFSMSPATLAETPGGPSTQWMQAQSKRLNAAVTGSIIILENGRYYNRLLWVNPDGVVQHYDKRHLFTLAGEEKVYAPGRDRLIVEWRGWRIMPLVCYDLRFPVWARNRILNGQPEYDLSIYVANWPERRVRAWSRLLQARAIENQSYVMGINRVGNDGNEVYHSGHSAIQDPFGEKIAEALPGEEQWLKAVLSKTDLDEVRQKLSFLADQDDFTISF